MRRRRWLISILLYAVLPLACSGGEVGDPESPQDSPTPTPIPTSTPTEHDSHKSNAEQSLIDTSFVPEGLEPSGVEIADEVGVASEAFEANDGTVLAVQTWEGENRQSGITFISDIRFEFATEQGATDFLKEAEAELTALVTTLTDPKTVDKKYTYLWATGNLVAFIVIGGSEAMSESDTRAGAVLVEQRMETITGVDSDGDGEIGA